MVRHPGNYSKATHGGSASYIKSISFSKDTGEIVDGESLELDVGKILEEEKYDGYYSIVTCELEISDRDMRETYRGLARIEDIFKVSKSELEARRLMFGQTGTYGNISPPALQRWCWLSCWNNNLGTNTRWGSFWISSGNTIVYKSTQIFTNSFIMMRFSKHAVK